VKEAQRVPMERVKHAHGRVREAVDFFDLEDAGGERAQDGASGFGAEVEGKVAQAPQYNTAWKSSEKRRCA
jgi:hypothetical protein